MSDVVKGSCKDCLAFAPLTSQCRRHAPVMVPVPLPTMNPPRIESMGLYPATSDREWCCEFVPDVSGSSAATRQ